MEIRNIWLWWTKKEPTRNIEKEKYSPSAKYNFLIQSVTVILGDLASWLSKVAWTTIDLCHTDEQNYAAMVFD